MRHHSLRIAWLPMAVVAMIAIPGLTRAQDGTWTAVNAVGTSPTPLREYGAAFDREGQRHLIFDGFNGNNEGLYILFNDVWELSVAGTPTWTHLAINGPLPGERHSPQFGYDAAAKRVFVFGGYGRHHPGDPYAYLNDVWQLSLEGTPQWTELTPAGQAPSGRLAGAAVFDPLRQRFVGFGGTVGAPVDTWALNLQGNGNGNWQNVPTSGAGPNGGYGMSSVYDAKSDRMLIFGGSTSDSYYGTSNDVWELDLHGTPTWNYITTAGTKPLARRSHTAIFDPLRNRMVIYGGFDGIYGSDQFLGDTWALDFNTSPATWSQLLPDGTIPHVRDAMSATYDAIHDRMIVYGGWGGTDMLSDTEFLEWGAASVEAALTASASATPNVAHLDWNVQSATGTHAAIYRRDAGGLWTARAVGEVDGSGHLVFDDATVQPGSDYSYMMVVASQRGETFGGVANVEIPGVTAVDPATETRVALTGVAPNPAVDRMSVSFALASAEPASFDLVDVTGRRVLSREVGSLGAGSHQIEIVTAGRVPPGVYFLRLAQGGRVATSRVAIAGTR